MPEDKGQLWDLLPFLAKLEEGGLARVLTEEIGDVVEGATVILGDVLEARVLGMSGGGGGSSSVGSSGNGHVAGSIAVGVGETGKMLLLSGGEGGLLLLQVAGSASKAGPGGHCTRDDRISWDSAASRRQSRYRNIGWIATGGERTRSRIE